MLQHEIAEQVHEIYFVISLTNLFEILWWSTVLFDSIGLLVISTAFSGA